MGKQTKTKRPNFVGKGKIKPIQIAFIVDRYLCDNSFTQTRSIFQTEAAHFLSKCHGKETPKTLLSLGDILEEYLTLKERKVWVEQERCRLEQENLRVQNCLKGMQNVMNVYNCGTNLVVAPSVQLPPSVVLGSGPAVTPIGHYPMYKSPSMVSVSRPLSNPSNLSTPVTTLATSKRKASKDVSGSNVMLKKSRCSTQSKDVDLVSQATNVETNQERSLMSSATHLSCLDNISVNGSQVQGSNVAKCLFSQKTPINSAVPETPPQDSSPETYRSKSPICSNATFSTPKRSQQTMSTNCTIMSSETIHVSPDKQIAYYSIEKRSVTTCSPAKASPRCSNVKDRVKGRLNFDASDAPIIVENQSPGGTSTSESDKEGDILDFNLDDLGLDFNLSEFLLEFERESEGLGVSSQQELNSSPDSFMGVPDASRDFIVDSRQQISSDMTGMLGDTEMNLMGPGSISTMRSITKRVILSPVKRQRSSLNQEHHYQTWIRGGMTIL